MSRVYLHRFGSLGLHTVLKVSDTIMLEVYSSSLSNIYLSHTSVYRSSKRVCMELNACRSTCKDELQACG